jgi:predicted NodU family carbamoyl transferase
MSAAYFKSSQDYEYHNGGNWPYWSAIYAYAKYLAGRDYRYPLESWFSYNLERGIFTPVEYFSPCRKSGSTLQAWSGAAAFVFDFIGRTLERMCADVMLKYGERPVIFAGGVMSNKLMRNRLSSRFDAYFSEPQFSADNAAGIALLCRRAYNNK